MSKINWDECLIKATDELKVAEVREEVGALLQGIGIHLVETSEKESFPFLDAIIDMPWGHQGRHLYNALDFNIKGNHEISFGKKNRLNLSDVKAKAFQIMENQLPLVEVEYDEDDSHIHKLFMKLAVVDGREIFLKIAEVYYRGED